MPPLSKDALGFYSAAELVFGIVSPLGVNYRSAVESLKNYLEQFGYSSNEIKISTEFESTATELGITVNESPYDGQAAAMWRKIKLGDKICETAGTEDFMALLATAMIEKGREPDPESPGENLPSKKVAHIVISLKRPEEVATLRRIYGPGFFLIGIAASDVERDKFFNEKGFSDADKASLIELDAGEESDFGQQTRDTFYLSDVFIRQLHT